MDAILNPILAETTKAMDQLMDAQEAYLKQMLSILGITVEEMAEKYVFETKPILINFEDHLDTDDYRMVFTNEFRLRLKDKDGN